jgi:hypothetical protein
LGLTRPLGRILEDLGDWSTFYKPLQPIFPSIDDAIRSATIRRTFFITEKGYIGIGPPETRKGDDLFLQPDGQTPFILREAGSRNIFRMGGYPRLGYINRNCFELIGYFYTHGLMDGEDMYMWRNISGRMERVPKSIILPNLLNRWQALFQRWERCSIDTSS